VTRPELMTHCAVPARAERLRVAVAHEGQAACPGPLVGAGSDNVNVTTPVGVPVAPADRHRRVKVTGAP